MHFHQSTIFFILERRLGIDLSKIYFGNLRGNNVIDPNDVSIATLIEEASGDDEKGGSNIAKDVEEVPSP